MKTNFEPLFNTALGIYERYSLNTEKIKTALAEIPDFRVTVPLVGGFSTGKSSLINAALGEKLLPVDITPETAVPTELFLGNDTAELISFDGNSKTLPLAEFDPSVLNVEKYKLVKIALSAPLFGEIPSVKIVDMPGFDSGIEFHDRAIDDYLPQSLAYIITFAADERTVRQSVLTFLSELKIHKVPVYTVITKSTVVDPATLEPTKAHIEDTLKRFLKLEEIKIVVTEAKGKRTNVEGFKEILRDIQGKSEDIFNEYFKNRLLNCCSVAEKFISDRLRQLDMTLDDLQLEKEESERKLEELDRHFSQEKDRFTQQLQGCVSTFRSKLECNLNAAASSMEEMLMQKMDITEKVKSIARTTAASVIQSELEPKVKKHIANVSELIDLSTYSKDVQLSEFQNNQIGRAEKFLNDGVKPIVSVIGAAIGALISGPLAPIGALIGGAIGALFSFITGNVIDNAKQKKLKEQARQQVRQIIDSAVSQVTESFESGIYKYSDEINASLAKEIEEKRSLTLKAIEDSEKKIQENTRAKEAEKAQLNADLEELRGIQNGI